ncbi:MAG: GDP-mannose 4,6-dehydratase [Candidatus Eiseniibacteriota bacterium]|jgi:UDP-glucose 4-epimerase
MASRALVTGVAGFIGSSLAGALLDRGWEVVGIDCLTDYYDVRLKEANLRTLTGAEGFRLERADLCEVDLDHLMDGVRVVYHQAAQAGVRASWGREFAIYTRQNIDATQRLLEHARVLGERHGGDAPIERFVYASSSSVYGQADSLPMRETDPTRPHSPYGVTKLAAEHLARLYHANFGVPTVSLRYFTVYGPRQRPDMAFNRFIAALLEGRELAVYGDGEQTRDFTFIDDIVEANLLAGERGLPGRIYNVGGGSRVTLRHCLDTLMELVGQGTIRHEAARHGDVRHTFADPSLARRELGWEPGVELEDGLRRQIAWQRACLTGPDRGAG